MRLLEYTQNRTENLWGKEEKVIARESDVRIRCVGKAKTCDAHW